MRLLSHPISNSHLPAQIICCHVENFPRSCKHYVAAIWRNIPVRIWRMLVRQAMSCCSKVLRSPFLVR